jgi:hypothetical protein
MEAFNLNNSSKIHHLSMFVSREIFIPLDFDSTIFLIGKLEELLVIKKIQAKY